MIGIRSLLPTFLAAGLAIAYTPPTTASWGALLTPDQSDPVTQGQTFTVTWDPASNPTDGVTVSLVLCRGNSANCVTASTAIVEGVPAAQKSYSWNVPCDLAVGVKNTDTGYGMLIIVDGSGVFQYSTQFSVLQGSSCASVATSSSSSTASSSASVISSIVGPNNNTSMIATSTASSSSSATSHIATSSRSGSSASTSGSASASTIAQTTVSLPTAPVTSPTVTASTGTTSTRHTTTSGTATGSASASTTSAFNEAGKMNGGIAGFMLAGVAAVMMAL